MRHFTPFSAAACRHRDHEELLVRYLTRVVAGLLMTGLVVVQPPVARPSAPATPTLISRQTASSVFAGSTERGRRGVEDSARALVASVGGLRVEPGDLGPWLRSGTSALPLDRCPPSDLLVSWVPPTGDHSDGAYVTPLGPPPTDDTTRLNGLVECKTSQYAFVGFEAAWNGTQWLLSAVPSLAEDTAGVLLAGEAEAPGATPAQARADESGDAALPPAVEWAGTPVEPLATYVPQTSCDPSAKPGVLGFRDLLLASFPGSRNLGIGRVCEAEGVSEHKEGRAFDWGVSVEDPAEQAAADTVVAWILGPDEAGEPYAIARRLGLMYVIWDGRIWSSFLADEGWRPYVGRSPHRDHIHFSFDWAGAMGQTTFWQGGRIGRPLGSAVPDLPLLPTVPRPLRPLSGGPALPALPRLLPGLIGPAPAAKDAPAAHPTAEPAAEPPPPEPSPTTTEPEPTTTTTAPPPPPTTTTTTTPVLPLDWLFGSK